jgi:MOSC domain-containing protein YiiM
MKNKRFREDYVNKFKRGDLIENARTGYYGIVMEEGQERTHKNIKNSPPIPYVKVAGVNNLNYKIYANSWEWERTEVLSRGIKDDEERRKNSYNEH